MTFVRAEELAVCDRTWLRERIEFVDPLFRNVVLHETVVAGRAHDLSCPRPRTDHLVVLLPAGV